jgi:hypothetical protein
LIRKDASRRIILLRNDKEYVYFDFSRKTGSSYRFRGNTLGDEPYTVTVSRNVTIESKAGKFKDCIRLYFDQPQYVDEEFGFVFAPNVGIVRRYGAWINAYLSSFEIVD